MLLKFICTFVITSFPHASNTTLNYQTFTFSIARDAILCLFLSLSLNTAHLSNLANNRYPSNIQVHHQPMQHSPNQNKHMPNRMIQIIIPHKERYATRISHSTRSQKPYCLHWQRLNQIWKANQGTPRTTKVHCQGEFGLVFPSPECPLCDDTATSTSVNEPE